LSETLRFTYSETLGKWPIGDLAFGINYLIRRQGNLQVAGIYAGENCVQLKGFQLIDDLKNLLRLCTLCILFSKKPFPVFLESAGYSDEDVLLQKPKAGLLKPAFTILRDKEAKCFLLLIRGTHSIKDTLTAATGAVVPFHHSVLHDGGVSNLVLGYAHCGMVAAARWIAKLSGPFLREALDENPDYNVKIVGHSLGGGTAALLTYILREQKEFISTTCITFAPAACMTWELAESGKHFITTIINGSDLVPTFSTASIDDLRCEVTASSWLNDLRDQVERTRVLNVVYRSATALGSRLPSIASAKARVAGAGALLRPVSSSTQVVIRRAQNVAQAVVRTRSSLSSWSCMGPRRRTNNSIPNSNEEESSETTLLTEIPVSEVMNRNIVDTHDAEYCSPRSRSGQEFTDEEDELMSVNRVVTTSNMEQVAENHLWYQLEMEILQREENGAHREDDSDVAKDDIIEEEKELISDHEVETEKTIDFAENHYLYPPGRIMHMVSILSSSQSQDEANLGEADEHLGVYETPRDLYSKIRLSKTMINDHYMPMYKKMMELLISKLENGDNACSSTRL
jgi:hypothetical protein